MLFRLVEKVCQASAGEVLLPALQKQQGGVTNLQSFSFSLTNMNLTVCKTAQRNVSLVETDQEGLYRREDGYPWSLML